MSHSRCFGKLFLFQHHGLSRRWGQNIQIVSWDTPAVSVANGVNKVADEALQALAQAYFIICLFSLKEIQLPHQKYRI